MTNRTITCLTLIVTAFGAGTYIYLSEDRLREAPETQNGNESAVSREEVAPVVPVGDFLYPNEASTSQGAIIVPVEEVSSSAGEPTITPPLPKLPAEEEKPVVQGQCRPGGCSGQLCTDRSDLASTCEWREEYACYQTAICERQPSGDCGWRETPELQQCLLMKGQAEM